MKILSLIGILLSIIGMFIIYEILGKQMLIYEVLIDLAKVDPSILGDKKHIGVLIDDVRKLCIILMGFFAFFFGFCIKAFFGSKKIMVENTRKRI